MFLSLINRRNAVNRAPDWKWHRAGEIIAARGRVTSGENAPDLAELFHFRRRYENAGSRRAELRIIDDFPHMWEAYTLYDSPIASGMKSELEARILSGESIEALSKRLSVCREILRRYESCFFNVIERLDNVSYIVHCVLLPDINAASPRRKHDGLLKSCAYAYGPVAVDVLCYPFQRQEERPDTPDKLLASLQAELKAALTVKAALVAKLLETKGINATEILKVQHKKVAVEQTEAPLEEYEKLKTHVKAFIESMPFERRKSQGVPDVGPRF